MLDDFKKLIFLELKKIEINYKSWKNAREITNAYNQDIPFAKKARAFVKNHERAIIRYLLVALGCAVLVTGIILSVNYSKKIIAEKKVTIVKDKVKPVKKLTIPAKSTLIKDRVKSVPAVSEQKLTIKKDVDSTKVIPGKATRDSVAVAVKPITSKKRSSIFEKIKNMFARLNYKTEKMVEIKPGEKLPKGMDTFAPVKTEALITAPGAVAKVVDTQPQYKPVHIFTTRKSALKADYYIIVANKAIRMLYLLKQSAEQEWAVEKEFPIAIGAGLAGPKFAAGDKRTPEGVYFILIRKNKNELSEVYGPLAYVLNYPNELDKREGKTGAGIWIHGTQSSGDPLPTKGCLSLSNENILLLASYLKDGKGTPVVIVNDSLLTDPMPVVDFKEVHEKRFDVFTSQDQLLATVNDFLSQWVGAWESRDIVKYQEYYSEAHFLSQGMRWDAWKAKKIQTFKAYNSIDVNIDRVRISDLTDDGVEVMFLQNYKSDQKYFENGKKLFLEKDKTTWKITQEMTIPKEELLL